MNQQLIPLILVVESHWLVGKMRRAPDQRVLDLLTESTSDFVNLEDVKVFSSFDRKNCLTTLPAMVVPKSRLQMVIIPTDRFEVARKHRIHKIAKKIQLETTTIVAENLVQGTLHLKISANNAQHILSDLLPHISHLTPHTLARDLRQTLKRQGCGRSTCQADRGTRWVTRKTTICGSVLTAG